MTEFVIKGCLDMIPEALKYSLAILSILGILIIFFARDIISRLLGPEFLPAVIPLTILVLAMIFSGSLISTGSVFSAVGRPDLAFKINLVKLVPNIGLDILLIPLLGITGAAIGTAASISVGTFLGIYLRIKILELKINLRYYPPVLISTAAMIAIFSIFENLFSSYLLAGIMLGIYVILIARFYLDKEDRKELKQAVVDLITLRS